MPVHTNLYILRLNRSGISLRKIGTVSARPSAIARRQLAPINKDLDRNMPKRKSYR